MADFQGFSACLWKNPQNPGLALSASVFAPILVVRSFSAAAAG